MLFRLLKDLVTRPAVAEVPDDTDNPLVHWYAKHRGRRLVKWLHYLDIYHRHFSRFRGRSPVVLEVGVYDGGSLDMWRDYFGAGCRLYGVDVEERCGEFSGPDATILIGDQADRDFLARVRSELPRIDILIDDGGHHMHQQITTFEELFPHVAEDGVYLCEDMHTSYWQEFGGGRRQPGSFVEFSKRLIDQLNAWHSREAQGFAVDDFTRTAYAMHYYDSVLVVDKRLMQEPRVVSTRG